mgnify:FL=1
MKFRESLAKAPTGMFTKRNVLRKLKGSKQLSHLNLVSGSDISGNQEV